MLHLTVAGLSGDNKRLLLVSDSGEQFSLAIDARLRAALRGEHARLGQLEITMESTLRPRDIQTRIRGGESPESVAQAAQTSVDKIMPFAAPVLAERAHVADRAQRSSVRRKSGDAGARTLGDAVSSQLRPLNVDPTSVDWDSWRREDGRWNVQVTPDGAAHPASFLFDVKSRYVVPADEFAHDLVGDVALPDSADMAIADAVRTPSRPSAPAIEAVDEVDEVVPEVEEGPQIGVASLKEARDRRALEQLAIGDADEAEDADTSAALKHEVDDFEDSLEHDVAVPDTMGPRKKRHERRRVPSWDEIMFGDNKSD